MISMGEPMIQWKSDWFSARPGPAKKFLFPFCLAVAFCACAACAAHAQRIDSLMTPRMVEVDGHNMRVVFSGLEKRKAGSPVVILEAGLSNSLDVWAELLPQLTPHAPVVAYDRAGMGKSEWDQKTPTPQHVIARLKNMLTQIGAEPPYVMVGYSWGGVLVRYFAGYYPDAVSGIVYVDPSPIITQSFDDEVAPFDSVGAGRKGYDALWSGFAAMMERSSEAALAEFDVMRTLLARDVSDRDLRSVPDVPVVVLIAAKPYPFFLKVPYDQHAHFKADVRHRVRMLQKWTLDSSQGTLVVSNHTTHAVPREDPELIAWAVKRVLSVIGEADRR